MESDLIANEDIPNFIKHCPLIYDWCKYKGETFFASLNYEESLKRNKLVFDLAYCATKAMNEIFLMQRVYNKNFELITLNKQNGKL